MTSQSRGLTHFSSAERILKYRFSLILFGPKIYIYQLLDFVGSPYETHLAITN